jgi:hypothetical protein
MHDNGKGSVLDSEGNEAVIKVVGEWTETKTCTSSYSRDVFEGQTKDGGSGLLSRQPSDSVPS